MKETRISRWIFTLLAVACAFSLGWILGSGGQRETVAVTVAAPQETSARAPAAAAETSEAAPAQDAQAPAAAPTEANPLNLNTATQAELELLPGIGPALAQAILHYRAEFGPFVTPEQLMEVSGIGEKRFAAVEQLIYVEETP